ncbi:MAG: hypothetical protein VKP62_15620 [Candidatus Sericytochromatia bacterium]|nr:hypothetical protein [Candidatus Sericytochromatia bacterium]
MRRFAPPAPVFRRSFVLALVTAALLGCQLSYLREVPQGSGRVSTKAKSPRPAESANPEGGDSAFEQLNAAGQLARLPANASLFGTLRAPARLLGDQAGSLIANNGGSIIANNGGTLIANNGGSLLERTRLYALQQGTPLEQVPVAGVTVELRDATGQAVKDAQGKVLTTTTDVAGRFAFQGALPERNLIVVATLPGARGTIQAVATKDRRQESLTADLISTLTTAYIMKTYVASQDDRQKVLDRLPGSVEQETRAIAETAFVKSGAKLPDKLDETSLVQATEALRRADSTLNQQLERVRQLLIVAGQSNLGEGRKADTVGFAATDHLREGPDGAIYFFEGRLWRVRPDGILETAMGGGGVDPDSANGKPAAELELGGSGLSGVDFDAAGRPVVLCSGNLIGVEASGTAKILHYFQRGEGNTDLIGRVGEAYYVLRRTRPRGDAERIEILKFTPGLPVVTLADVQTPPNMRFGEAGLDPTKGVLVKFWDFSKPEQFQWYNLQTGAMTPWDPALGRTADFSPEPVLDVRGNVLFRNPQGRLRAWQPEGTAPLAFDNWEGSWSQALLARDGKSMLVGSRSRVFRVTPAARTAIAGVDPDAQISGQAGDLALLDPIALTVATDETIWLIDRVRGGLMRIDTANQVQSVKLTGTTFREDEDSIMKFPRLKPAAAGDVYLDGRLQAGSGIHLIRKDQTTERLYASPDRTNIIDFDPMPDGTLLILLESRETPHRLVRRAPDGTVTTLFESKVVVNTVANSNITYNTHNPDLRDCDLVAEPDGSAWICGRGQLAKWSAANGYAVIKKAGHFLRTEDGNGNTPRKAFTRGPDGALYFTPGDPGNGSWNQVRRFDPKTGNETMVAGSKGGIFNGTTVDNRLQFPHSPAFTPSGELLFVDGGARQIKRIPKDKLLGLAAAGSDDD